MHIYDELYIMNYICLCPPPQVPSHNFFFSCCRVGVFILVFLFVYLFLFVLFCFFATSLPPISMSSWCDLLSLIRVLSWALLRDLLLDMGSLANGSCQSTLWGGWSFRSSSFVHEEVLRGSVLWRYQSCCPFISTLAMSIFLYIYHYLAPTFFFFSMMLPEFCRDNMNVQPEPVILSSSIFWPVCVSALTTAYCNKLFWWRLSVAPICGNKHEPLEFSLTLWAFYKTAGDFPLEPMTSSASGFWPGL